ncbi:hypothetical protein ACNJT3_21085, partial [Mycobacterium tuberculosis]
MSLELDIPKPLRRERRPLVDPLSLAAAVFFVVAVAVAAYLAWVQGPAARSGLILLLIGLGGVALVVVFTFLSGDGAPRE